MRNKLANEVKILSMLEQIAEEQGNHVMFQLLKTEDESSSAEIIRYVSSLSAPLQEVLQDDPLFNSEKPLMISSGENGSTSFDADRVARTMVKKAAANRGPQSAMRWIKKVLSTASADGFHVMAISDIVTESIVCFENGVKLMPLNTLPYSRSKDFLLGKRYSRWGSPGAQARPTAALVLPTTIDSFFYQEDANRKISEEDVFRSYNVLDKVRLAVSAVGPCCPINVGFWFSYKDKDLEDATFSSSSMTKMVDIPAPPFGQSRTIDLEQAKQTVNAFFQLDSKTESRCLIALDRLNQSIRRSASRGDKCLDLAMALETLLVNDSGEHSYKVSLRSALIAGTTVEDKLRIRAVTRALYDVRSRLVHTGKDPETVKLPNGYDAVRTYDLIEEAEELVSKILRQIILKGGVPNWFEYELCPDENGAMS